MTRARSVRCARWRGVAIGLVIGALTMSFGPARHAESSPEGSGELNGGRLGVGIEIARGTQPVPVEAGSSSLPRLIPPSSRR